MNQFLFPRKEEYHQHIGIYPNLFPKDYCEELIDVYENRGLEEVTRSSYDDARSSDKEDFSVFFDLLDPKYSKYVTFFNKNLMNIWDEYYCKKYNGARDIGPVSPIDFKLQKTIPGGGYHIWHAEGGGMFPLRVGVFTLYLNDIEDGGETEFLYQSFRLPPTTGTLCIFPASYPFQHRGNPPLKGTKYIVTGWIECIPLPDRNNEFIRLSQAMKVGKDLAKQLDKSHTTKPWEIQ